MQGPEHVGEVKPVVFPNTPAGQLVHVRLLFDPTTALYVPAMHGMGSTEPNGQKLPKVQLKQDEFDAAPVVGLYVPEGHCVEFMEERGQNEPAGHITGAPEEQ